MRAWRLPILLVLPALLVGALVVQDRRGSDGSATADVTDAVPMVAPAGSVGSTWYCAAGTASRASLSSPSLLRSHSRASVRPTLRLARVREVIRPVRSRPCMSNT